MSKVLKSTQWHYWVYRALSALAQWFDIIATIFGVCGGIAMVVGVFAQSEPFTDREFVGGILCILFAAFIAIVGGAVERTAITWVVWFGDEEHDNADGGG